MNIMLKIGVITPYYGAMPDYFPIWLKSCERNPTIDFLLITDETLEAYQIPENVRIITMPFSELKALAQSKIGMPVSLPRPYKLCDYRPAYGLIFEDYLTEYDYWGHCDIDLVWGNLQEFFERNGLEQYDKFLDRGHLSLYRNDSDMKYLFMRETDTISYKNVFANEASCFFDESPMVALCKLAGKRVFDRCIYADINLFYHDFRHAAHHDRPKNYRRQLFCWEDGRIFQVFDDHGALHRIEWLYLHFQKRKLEKPEQSVLSSDRFFITNHGFIPFRGEVTKEMIDQYNPLGSYRENLNRRETVYCGKCNLRGQDFVQYLVLRTKSVICNSTIWTLLFRKLWIKAKIRNNKTNQNMEQKG